MVWFCLYRNRAWGVMVGFCHIETLHGWPLWPFRWRAPTFYWDPDFVADPQSFFGDNKFSLRLIDFLWGPPDLHCKPPDFHKRPQIFLGDRPQIFIGDLKILIGALHILVKDPNLFIVDPIVLLETPKFSLETQEFRWRLTDFHWRPQILDGDPRF